MKKLIILFLFIVLNISSSYAGNTRLIGMNGNYFVPDNEFDTMNLFYGFAHDFDRMEIYNDISYNSSYSKTVNKNYRGVDIPAKRDRRINSQDLLLTEGFIGRLNERIALGIFWQPYFSYYKNESNEYADSVNGFSDKRTIIDKNRTLGLLNLSGGVAINSGSLKLGVSGGYSMYPSKSLHYDETDGDEDESARSKGKGNSHNISAGIDFLMGYDENKIGIGTGIDITIRSRNDSFDYETPPYDFWLAEYNDSGISMPLNFLIQRRISKQRLFRIALLSYLDWDKTSRNYIEDSVERRFGEGSYEATYKYIENYNISTYLNTEALFSLIRDSEYTRFFGFKVAFIYDYSKSEYDNDTRIPAAVAWDEYTSERTDIDIDLVIAAGVEKKAGKIFILRSGIDMTLFNFDHDTYREHDAIDGDTDHDKNYSFYFIRTLTLTGGLGLNINDRIKIDTAVGFDLFGLDLGFSKDTPDLHDSTRENKVVNTSFSMNVNANFSIIFLL